MQEAPGEVCWDPNDLIYVLTDCRFDCNCLANSGRGLEAWQTKCERDGEAQKQRRNEGRRR